MHKLLSAVLAVLLLAVVPTAAVFACGGSHQRFVPSPSGKPQISLQDLSEQQRAQLQTFATSLKKSIEADLGELNQNKISKDEVGQRIRTSVKTFADSTDFITTFEVGNGMLCGARIKIQMPPSDRDLAFVVLSDRVMFLIRGSARDGTVDEGHLDPDQFLRIIESAGKR